MNSLYLPGSEATCMVERTKLAALCVGLVVKTGMGSAPSTLLSGQGGERPGTPPCTTHHGHHPAKGVRLQEPGVQGESSPGAQGSAEAGNFLLGPVAKTRS